MDNFRVINSKEINTKMLAAAVKLDKMVYDERYWIDTNKCIEYFEKNCDIYIIAIEEKLNQVVGYINFTPIKDSVYEQILNGSFIDTSFNSDDILEYKNNKLYYGYLSSIVVHPKYREQGIAEQMTDKLSLKIANLAIEKGIFFREIAADAVTDSGLRLLLDMGFSVKKQSNHQSTIVTMNLFSRSIKRSRFNNKLIEVYTKTLKMI